MSGITQAARQLALRSVEVRRRKGQKLDRRKGQKLGTSFAEQMSELGKRGGKRSVEARIRKWGGKGLAAKMREWGKRGGRPRKDGKSNAN